MQVAPESMHRILESQSKWPAHSSWNVLQVLKVPHKRNIHCLHETQHIEIWFWYTVIVLFKTSPLEQICRMRSWGKACGIACCCIACCCIDCCCSNNCCIACCMACCCITCIACCCMAACCCIACCCNTCCCSTCCCSTCCCKTCCCCCCCCGSCCCSCCGSCCGICCGSCCACACGCCGCCDCWGCCDCCGGLQSWGQWPEQLGFAGGCNCFPFTQKQGLLPHRFTLNC